MCGSIYLIINLINDKKYVGQTIQKGKRRLNAHKRDAIKYKSQLPIHRAIRKYGIENFKYETIEWCDSIDALNMAETKWILTLDTFGPNGYNCTTGGEGFIVSDKTKQKISKARIGIKLSDEHCLAISNGITGENNPFYGKKHSKETIQKIKDTLKGQMDGENNPFYGKKHSEETRKKLSQNHIGLQAGEKHPRAKLTQRDVLEIRNIAEKSNNKKQLARDLSKQYNVGKKAIEKIIYKHTWRHI
jgi:group I intron endonuclease